MNQRKQTRRTWVLPLLTSTFILSAQGPAGIPTRRVDCSRNNPELARTVAIADPGETILISGTCREKIRITKGPLTLDGGGSAILQGEGLAFQIFEQPMIAIDGAQGVVVKNLRIEDGPDAAISVGNGSAAKLQNVTLRKSTIGLLVYGNSTAEVIDTILENNFVGVDVLATSSLVLRGTVRANSNLSTGLDFSGNSAVEIRGAKVEASDNGSHGVVLYDSKLAILGYPPAAGSQLTTNRNARSGVTLAGTAAMGLFNDPANPTAIVSSDNKEQGLWLLGGQIFSMGGARIAATGNVTGMLLESGAAATIAGGLEIRNNNIGIQADGAGMIHLRPLRPGAPRPSSISGNASTDLHLRFGSRIRVAPDVTVGKVFCADKTVLTDGVSCP